jgi:ABC-type uncharacterized transport system auxiliary subunit
MRAAGRAFAVTLVAAVTGCAGSAPLPPYDLWAAPTSAKHAAPLIVDAPTAAPNLDSDRILVIDQGSPYVLADAKWDQPLPALVAARVAESLDAPDGPPRAHLALDIRHFELIADRKVVAIEFDATLLGPADVTARRHKTFRAEKPVESTAPDVVAAGFNAAFASLQPGLAAFAFAR